jgi:hypothetical protein
MTALGQNPREREGAVTLYERSSEPGPVIPGDGVDKRFLGACCLQASSELLKRDQGLTEEEELKLDLVLWADEKGHGELPAKLEHLVDVQRRCQSGTASWARAGEIAPAPLERSGQVFDASSVRPGLVDAFTEVLGPNGPATWRPGREVVALSPIVTDALVGQQHLVWVVGGSVRDLIDGFPPGKVNDVDLAGTAPPGVFRATVHGALRAKGFGDLRFGTSPASLVCHVGPPDLPDKKENRLLEYKPLVALGFPAHACGTSFAEDLCTRDLTVNALFYDERRHVVLDASGSGIGDVKAHRLRSPNTQQDGVEQANVAFRAIKMQLRWQKAKHAIELGPLTEWLAQRGGNSFPTTRSNELAEKFKAAVKDFSNDDVDLAAAVLGEEVVRLVQLARQGGDR